MERQDRAEAGRGVRQPQPRRERRRARSRRSPARSGRRRTPGRRARAARRCSPGAAPARGARPRRGPRARPRSAPPGDRSAGDRPPAGGATRRRPGGRPGDARSGGRSRRAARWSSPARPRPVSTSRWMRSARRGRGPRSPRQAASAAATIRPSSSSLDAVTATSRRIAARTTAARDRVQARGSGHAGPLPELDRLVERGDREAVRPGRLEGPPDRHRAVAVGVGLEHRLEPDAGREGGPQTRRGCPAAGRGRSRARPSGAAGRDRPRRGAPRSGGGRSRAGRRRAVPAHPESEPGRPRPPLRRGRQALPREGDLDREVAGRAARRRRAGRGRRRRPRRGGRPRAARRRTGRGPGRGASRSCRPGRRRCRRDARAGFSNGARAARPSGAAITVRAPLRTTTWPHCAGRGPRRRRPRGVVVDEVAVGVRRDPARRPQPGELAGMRGQDARPADPLPPAVARRPATGAPRRRRPPAAARRRPRRPAGRR